MSEALVPFEAFGKIARLSRDCVITEKIDGTNAQIVITEDGGFYTGSRKRWITPEDDNFGFSRWAHEHKDELVEGLGKGRHFGEWWGPGIQRGYGVAEKTFSLFNVKKWNDDNKPPACCSVVPVLYSGRFFTADIRDVLEDLRIEGSAASPGFMRPEGIIVYHIAAGVYFKKTLENDEEPKSKAAA